MKKEKDIETRQRYKNHGTWISKTKEEEGHIEERERE